jgi:intracellular septation protein
MQILFDLLPLLAFFIAYKFADIYVATAVIVVSVFLVLGYRLLRKEKITTLQKLSAGLLLALGGLTLILHDDRFILWKPTVYYWLVSGGLLASLIMSREPVLRQILGEGINVPKELWNRVTWIWAVGFAALGVLNLYIAFNYSRDTWVISKFVLLGLFMAMVFATVFWIVLRAEQLEAASGTPAPDKSGAPQ